MLCSIMASFTVEIPPFDRGDEYTFYPESNEQIVLESHDSFESGTEIGDIENISTRTTRSRKRAAFIIDEEEDEDNRDSVDTGSGRPTRVPQRQRTQQDSSIRNRRSSRHLAVKSSAPTQESDSSETGQASRRRSSRVTNNTRTARRQNESKKKLDELRNDSSSADSNDFEVLRSDIAPYKKRRSGRVQDARDINGLMYERGPTRQSTRMTRHQQNMKETLEQEVQSDSSAAKPAKPKFVGSKEVFKALPRSDPFVARHCHQCETCGHAGGAPLGQLIPCQSCTLSYHKNCLGNRNSRDHLVTKIGEDNFVLQCRRCTSLRRRREATAPDQGMCQLCREIGAACHPFRDRKTAAQEEKEREGSDGTDPVVQVAQNLINNPDNVLFRCMSCWRAFHYEHLLPLSGIPELHGDETIMAHDRYHEYAQKWKCRECIKAPAKVASLVAWRPVDRDANVPGTTVEAMNEDDKAYLIKWDSLSYFHCQWMPGAWTWGMTASVTRKSFASKREAKNGPIMRTEDAIPEDFMRIDLVLDVRFTSIVNTRGEEIDKARIREVDKALLKFKGLGYEDAVWDKVPTPDDGDRWIDFVTAYETWVAGRYIKIPKSGPLKSRLDKARSTDFTLLEKSHQPESLVGGELMKYQIEGVNWLYYRWYMKKNAILADEMGLGKTIQIIAMLSVLVKDHNCFPFLIVVPNSTCAAWRREIKRWAPSLRVVTYFGSSATRALAYRHELFPEGSKELRCHIVVTSYEAVTDENCRRFFRSVPWQALIVDEGQRLKSDKNMIYESLSALKIPFRLLLTGTPLQNNARELFNLLQFLDDSFDAAALEIEYATLTKENVPALHTLIRPFFLRRTKAQVLTFLPPMAQVIVPISMTLVQKRLYQSILSKNPEFIRALFDSSRPMGKGEKTNLSNILMQLRKCLCHPFVYSAEMEQREVSIDVSHRNLVDASAKLQLLEILLPKLKKRGHRVLLFSQFLGMLDIMEDFLEGLGLRYQRLDGTINSLEKQKRIDEYNAKDSPLFAFLLSTRA